MSHFRVDTNFIAAMKYWNYQLRPFGFIAFWRSALNKFATGLKLNGLHTYSYVFIPDIQALWKSKISSLNPSGVRIFRQHRKKQINRVAVFS